MPDNLGEKVAALLASFEAEKEYQHDRWHKLDNDLTPVVNLPERLTREIGRLQGVVDGKIGAVSEQLGRSMEAAIERAIKPISEEVGNLRNEVEALKKARQQFTGARIFGIWLLQTVIAVASAIGTVLALGGRHTP